MDVFCEGYEFRFTAFLFFSFFSFHFRIVIFSLCVILIKYKKINKNEERDFFVSRRDEGSGSFRDDRK